MPSAIFHCKYCGKKYRTTKEDILNSSRTMSCPNCGKETNVVFFDCCPKCHENVDFYDNGRLNFGATEFIADLGSNFMKGFLNPIEGVMHGINRFKTKNSNGAGICPICNTRYVRCVSCNELTEIPLNANATDIITCVNCGENLYPSPIRDGKGADHSIEYYKIGS